VSSAVLTEGLPSQEERSTWIYAYRKVGDYPDPTEFSGKWLMWFHVSMIDRSWQKIKEAVEQGNYLGNTAKVATARGARASMIGPGYRSDNDEMRGKFHVVCVYTYDWTDIIDVMGIRQALRELGVRREIRYKADEDTRQGRYRSDYTPIYRA
jgi:Domain of unknown function (DUF1917)